MFDKQGHRLKKDDIVALLKLRQKNRIGALLETARKLRTKHFGHSIHLYGFLYTGTYCRNNCKFCFFRSGNRLAPRYRKTEDEIIAAAVKLAESGVHLIDLTMGEDPKYVDDEKGFSPLIRLVEQVKQATNLPIMVSPGVIPETVLYELKQAGADWYACYQETHNRGLFKTLRPGQDYESRFAVKQSAKKQGLKIEEGILVGIGETDEDIADSIESMRTLSADQVRAMNFVPQAGTPMANHPPPDPVRELLTIAILRLAFPDKLIPATLDVEGLNGLKRRIDAGANVVTSIVPPMQGLAGVAQSSLDIDDARRTTTSVATVLEKCGLTT